MSFADCSAVILDMDGLVLDTEKTYFIAWQKAAEMMGFELTSLFCQSLSGLQYQVVEQRLLKLFGGSFQIEQFRRLSSQSWYQYVEANGIDVKKGFYDLMIVLKQYDIPYCLATNSNLKNALECLALAGINDLFPLLITRDQVKSGKPSPDIFLEAARQLRKLIGNCLVAEDSSIGVQAARSAGAYTVYIPSSQPERADAADLMLEDLRQLAGMIQKYFYILK
jgi:HAD superfamily hydrolase (TIGR01509 family)